MGPRLSRSKLYFDLDCGLTYFYSLMIDTSLHYGDMFHMFDYSFEAIDKRDGLFIIYLISLDWRYTEFLYEELCFIGGFTIRSN